MESGKLVKLLTLIVVILFLVDLSGFRLGCQSIRLDQLLDLLLRLLLVTIRALGPYPGILGGVGFDLGPIQEVVLQLDIAFFQQQLQHCGEAVFDDPLHHLRTKAVGGPKNGLLAARQPHEVDVLLQALAILRDEYNPLGIFFEPWWRTFLLHNPY